MAINKAQGQTLKKVEVHLNEPVFSHGQLYVAMSWSGDPQSTKLVIKDIENKQGKFSDERGTFVCINNVVYTEAIDLLLIFKIIEFTLSQYSWSTIKLNLVLE